MPRARLLAAAAAFLSVGCTPTYENTPFPLAHSPAGLQVTVATRPYNRVIHGELLAVGAEGIHLYGMKEREDTAPRIYLLAWEHFNGMKATAADVPRSLSRQDSAAVERVRLLARFPAGIPAAALPRLLAAARQDSVLPAGP